MDGGQGLALVKLGMKSSSDAADSHAEDGEKPVMVERSWCEYEFLSFLSLIFLQL